MNRTCELIQRRLDEYATASDVAELDGLLRASSEAADMFVRAQRMQLVLEEFVREGGVRESLAAVAALPNFKTANRARGRRLWTAAMPAAVVLLAAGLGVSFRPTGPATRHCGVVSGRVLVDGIETGSITDGSRVEVAGDTSAVIRLADGSHVELNPEAAIVLHHQGSRTLQMELDRGGGRFHVAGDGRRLRVDTPAGTVTGRGTEFSLELRPEAEKGEQPMKDKVALLLAVAVMAGDVEVRSKDRSYVLASGEAGLFAPQKKGGGKIPMLTGKVTAVSADGKQITVETPPPKPGVDPQPHVVHVTDQTKLSYFGVEKDADRPTVGYRAMVLLDPEKPDTATSIEFGIRDPQVSGRVTAVSADGKALTLAVYRKGQPLAQAEVRLTDRTRLSYSGVDREGEKPTEGYAAQVWLREGSPDAAVEVRFVVKNAKGKADTPAPKAKEPANKKKPLPDKSAPKAKEADDKKRSAEPAKSKAEEKDKEGSQPPEPAKPRVQAPARDPMPLAVTIDRAVDERLHEARVPPSPRSDDAEFLRRVTIDIIGQIPSYERTIAFLSDTHPGKRRELIEELLASSDYGRHFGGVWRNLMAPREVGKGGKAPPVDHFSPWLAKQFNEGRGWNEIVYDLLTVDGDVSQKPQTGFIMANAENFHPQADRLAASAARLFLGVQLQCAQCHNHPFTAWTQADFWATAAFFSRLRNTGKKGPPFVLTETADIEPAPHAKNGTVGPPPMLPAGAVVIPTSAGKGAGNVVRARFLGGSEPALNEEGPYRPAFAAWVTAPSNPYFANAAVNRLWAHFFGRGLVNPVDNFHSGNLPSHPALLELLANELTISGGDFKHLIRGLCNSQAYQRTSRPLTANEADRQLFSHMAMKVMGPEVFFDSLVNALGTGPGFATKGGKARSGKKSLPSLGSREQFVQFFTSQSDAGESDESSHGIPQFLKLMNAEPFNRGAPIVDALVRSQLSGEQAIQELYLSVLSRRPTADEVRLLSDYLSKRTDARSGYAGALWILINSSEFAMNH
jgi:ferric-dicitrate binding protein FerR (iron transport regulator)